jgi:predicted Rossmann fold flavoprotein
VNYDVIIVGAGASGLMAAIMAARQGSSVLVIERKDKAGKKILATGNGKCNYTNMFQAPQCYRSNDSAFAMKVLSCFDVTKTLEFFGELGIYPKERDGYLYPNSEQAASVLQVLMMECRRLEVNFQYNEIVTDIIKPLYTVVTEQTIYEEGQKKNPNNKNKPVDYKSNENRSKSYGLNTGKLSSEVKRQSYSCKHLILAAGGCASPQLGSDGSGYKLAKLLGHTIIKPLPALVQLKSPDKYCKTISGVRTTAEVTVLAEKKQIAKEEGEILFTDYGISGIPIMQVSRFVAKALDDGAHISLLLDFLPELSKEQLKIMLHQRLRQNPEKNLEEMMVGFLNHKLSYVIILQAKLDPYKQSKVVTIEEVDDLAKQMKCFRMLISETNSFEHAQVSAGGIDTREIDASTMESKLSKDLFLVGELVDVDGTCGGYNLQWAWSSGHLAGSSAGGRGKQ